MASGTTRGPHEKSNCDARPISAQIFERGAKTLVGGVDSPVRAFGAVGGTPLVIDHAAGTSLYDVDGREYLDYVCSWGALILGHAHPDVVSAVADQAAKGTSYGMTSPLEVELGELIVAAVPSVEMVRFVSSGTEAAMSAVRLARAFTGRDMVIKFEGCYHGHSDGFLSEAGSGLATLGIAACPGVPDAFARLTLNTPYNDLGGVEELFRSHPGQIAAVIVEPVAANMGVVAPDPGFLEGLREITKREAALLIFDEVITGFRLAYGGAQAVYKITPDLTVMGKIIGGGLPVAAYGGRREIMERVAPLGPVYQAGTLSGNPVAVAAGLATLRAADDAVYAALDANADRLAALLSRALTDAGVPHHIPRAGNMLSVFFGEAPVTDFASARASETWRFPPFFHALLDGGVYPPCSAFEAWFVSAALDDAAFARIADALPIAARRAAAAAAKVRKP